MAKGKDIEEQLRQAVRAAGPFLTTARKSGVDVGTVSRYARGERDITTRTASKLAAVLGLELRPVKARKGR